MPKTLRTFIAIEFSASLRQQLGEISQQLAPAAPKHSVNWVKPSLIHLTLKFLGDTPEAALPDITAALAQIASQIGPFTMTTGPLGCFPNPRRPRVVWLGLDAASTTRFIKLQQAVETAIVPLGFPGEDRAFSPHITLGRVRRETSPALAAKVGEAVRALEQPPAAVEAIQSVALVKSDLGAGGPVYTSLYNVPLAGR